MLFLLQNPQTHRHSILVPVCIRGRFRVCTWLHKYKRPQSPCSWISICSIKPHFLVVVWMSWTSSHCTKLYPHTAYVQAEVTSHAGIVGCPTCIHDRAFRLFAGALHSFHCAVPLSTPFLVPVLTHQSSAQSSTVLITITRGCHYTLVSKLRGELAMSRR